MFIVFQMPQIPYCLMPVCNEYINALIQADALVNAGPSVFISSTGPNPIMVQVIFFS